MTVGYVIRDQNNDEFYGIYLDKLEAQSQERYWFGTKFNYIGRKLYSMRAREK